MLSRIALLGSQSFKHFPTIYIPIVSSIRLNATTQFRNFGGISQRTSLNGFSLNRLQCRNFWHSQSVPQSKSWLTQSRTFATNSSSESSPLRRRIVGWWLLASSSMVFGIVVVGGLTRLTESGLSIVDWRPITGSIPPLSQADWQVEFTKYKDSPEYKLHNSGMSLEEFKKIFWMEWGHRQLGRTLGLFYLFPALFFVARGWVEKPMAKRILLIGGLIGFQGLLGWLMVKSGLDNRIVEERDVPRVSHYRLAAHLGTAFVIYILGIWNSLTLLQKPIDAKLLPALQNPSLRFLSKSTHGVAGLIFLTALSGAFVAGLDAGLVYNEFPLMGGRWIPSDLLAMSPKWKNFLENPTTVQFDHRYLGMGTAASILALWGYGERLPLPPRVRLALRLLGAGAIAQVSLGIATLLTFVPVSLASAHQTGSITLLTLILWLMHTLRHVPK